MTGVLKRPRSAEGRTPGPALSRLDRLFPIGPLAKGDPALR